MSDVTVELRDSRRLTGPSLMGDVPGAVIDGGVAGVAVAELVDAWETRAREALDALGWTGEHTAARPYEGGVTVFLSAIGTHDRIPYLPKARPDTPRLRAADVARDYIGALSNPSFRVFFCGRHEAETAGP